MEDGLILATGRTLIDLSAQKEEIIQALKRAQEVIKQLEAKIKELEKHKE